MATIRNVLGDDNKAKRKVFALMNTLFSESAEESVKACNSTTNKLLSLLTQRGASLIFSPDKLSVIAEYMTEILVSMIVRGVYCASELPDDKFISDLQDTISFPAENKINMIKNSLSKLYGRDISSFARSNIVYLINNSIKESTDIKAPIDTYFTYLSPNTLSVRAAAVREGKKS